MGGSTGHLQVSETSQSREVANPDKLDLIVAHVSRAKTTETHFKEGRS